MTESILQVKGLNKSFGGVVATDNLDFEVKQGEIHAVIGPNGAGKTTFVAQLAGMLSPDSGEIFFVGEEISSLSAPQRSHMGLARSFQITSVFPNFSALENVALSIQAQVVNLLLELQKKFSLTFLFIAHDLSVIKYISDRVLVMYLGKIVEQAKTEELFKNPKHPYTEALISSVPIPNPQKKVEQIILDGDVPSPLEPPPGCVFHTRCRYAQDICKTDIPPIKEMGSRHFTSCHFADTLKLNTGTL